MEIKFNGNKSVIFINTDKNTEKEFSRAEFESYYLSQKRYYICKELEISQNTFAKVLNTLKISLKNKPRNSPLIGRPRKHIDEKTFRKIYQENSIRVAMKKLGMSGATFYKFVDLYNVKKKRKTIITSEIK